MSLDLQHLHAAEGKSTGARALVVAGRPELARRDRKFLHLYVNRRRIADFSLLQAAEYAFGQYVPGGSHPVAFLFLEVDPALVDFNIHPAKKEARFRNLAELRQLLIGTLRGLPGGFRAARGFAAREAADRAGGRRGHRQGAGEAWKLRGGIELRGSHASGCGLRGAGLHGAGRCGGSW